MAEEFRVCPGWNPARPHGVPVVLEGFATARAPQPQVSICHDCMVHMIGEIGRASIAIENERVANWLAHELEVERPRH